MISRSLFVILLCMSASFAEEEEVKLSDPEIVEKGSLGSSISTVYVFNWGKTPMVVGTRIEAKGKKKIVVVLEGVMKTTIPWKNVIFAQCVFDEEEPTEDGEEKVENEDKEEVPTPPLYIIGIRKWNGGSITATSISEEGGVTIAKLDTLVYLIRTSMILSVAEFEPQE